MTLMTSHTGSIMQTLS